ncbi:MAG: LysM peptidoglycan-binding domain-containing protein [Thermomicrobiales bacterium]|nr:LysM domain-containing protein [Thermomicrobiales bacterium]
MKRQRHFTPWGCATGIIVCLLFLTACGPGGSGATATPTTHASGTRTAVATGTTGLSPIKTATTTAPSPPPTAPPPTAPPAPTATKGPPKSATATPAQGTPPGKRYEIQPGDTIESIAAQFGVTVQDLIDANRLQHPDLLQVGQIMIIPNK